LLPYITKRIVIVVEVVEASEHINHHLIKNLEHKGIINTVSISTKTVGAASNDAKFLTSSRSSAHIPNNFWSWTISSQPKRGEKTRQ
jgi:hypothetical protein